MMNYDGPTESANTAQGPQNSSPYSALDSELESYMVHAAAILATKSKHPERQARLAAVGVEALEGSRDSYRIR